MLTSLSRKIAFIMILFLLTVSTEAAMAHCDSMDGPLVKVARKALDTGNINPVLAWVTVKDEAEVKKAFQSALTVRKAGGPAKELAEMYFLETVVRLHRVSEGASYTGLKPAGTELSHGVLAADSTITKGSAGPLAKEFAEKVKENLLEKFVFMMEKRKHQNDSVEAGREYVAAYIQYFHLVEELEALLAHNKEDVH